ncbi:MAG: small multi-drug export protein [Clostridiales Family XIII bacterium]|nr:small multi-drug export protein [Clostridiales Family XIII bacterium]
MERFSQLALIALMSMTPVIELKGSIITGLAMGYPLWEVFAIAWLFSCLPAPVVIIFLKPLTRRLRHLPRLRGFLDRRVSGAMRKAETIRKYSLLGLFAFVAIPLPGTGVWSGSVISAVLDLDVKKSVLVISLGNLVAGVAILTVFNGIFGIIR